MSKLIINCPTVSNDINAIVINGVEYPVDGCTYFDMIVEPDEIVTWHIDGIFVRNNLDNADD